MKRIFLLVVALIAITAPVCASAFSFSGAVASFGDYLSSWGRSGPATQANGVLPPPPLAQPNPCDQSTRALAAAQQQTALANSVIQPHQQSFADTSCLSNLANLNISSSLGFPDLSSLMSQAMGQACTYAASKIQAATQPLNQTLFVPGGLGQINTGALIGAGSGPGVTVSTPTNNGSFILPQIFGKP